MRRRALLPALLAGAAVLASCAADPREGWSSASTFPDAVRSVAVPIFENDTLVREVEFDLTDALVREIRAATPYTVLSTARADTVLTGRIRRVEIDSLSRSRLTGLSEEVLMGVTIDFQWKDLRTDRVLMERTGFTGQGLFVPSAPAGEPIEWGRFDAVQQLARSVVDEMRDSW